ncbi:ScbA/BarX family gamma-butyrolactone biosynthesis protein [Streptomyces sp. NPDC051684]|uniref:ScbA/BarX family gamma-butyrolactone biosynthesis protein n=1 Tax=Streptomyces sp. NPDC051684 TaxID=3365670 RepID=UPI00378D2097
MAFDATDGRVREGSARTPGQARVQAHVHRASVHKAADGEVLLGDAVQLEGGRFVLALRWHRDHFLGHRGGGAAGDPLLLAEAVRQAAIHLSHRFYAVPGDHAFILCDLHLERDGELPAGGPDAAPLVMEATFTPMGRGRRFDMRMAAEVFQDGRRVARGGMRWMAVDRARYATLRLRGTTHACVEDIRPVLPPGPPADRDRLVERVAPNAWRLRIDPAHPVLFDHGCDHIPGMVLMEAVRQVGAALRPEHARPAAIESAFHSFGELDTDTTLTSRQLADGVVEVTVAQGARTLASISLAGAAC